MSHHIKFSWVYISNQLLPKKSLTLSRQRMIQYGQCTLSSTDNQPIFPAFTAPCWLHSRARNRGYVTCVAGIPIAGHNSTSGSCSCRNSTAARKQWGWNITHTLHYFVWCNSQFLEQLCSKSQILPHCTLLSNYKWFCKIPRVYSSKIHNKVCSVVGEQHCFEVTFCLPHNDWW